MTTKARSVWIAAVCGAALFFLSVTSSAYETGCARLVGRTFANADVVAVNNPGPWVPGPYLYVGDHDVLWVLDATGDSETLVQGHLVLSGVIESIAVSGLYVFVAAGDAGLRVIDVSDPSAPVEVGSYDAVPAFDVGASGSHAYVAAGEEGLRVVDLHDPSSPFEVATIDRPGLVLQEIAVSGSLVYCLQDDIIEVLDVSRPWAPVAVGSYEAPGPISVFTVSGNYAYVGWSLTQPDEDAGIEIIDMSDPRAPIEISTYRAYIFDDPAPIESIFAFDNHLFLTCGWWDWVFGSLFDSQIVDVTDPAEPFLAGDFPLGGHFDPDRIAASGSFLYRATSGPLEVIDVSDPVDPVSVGLLGTPVYGGAAHCGSYAFLDSETVIDAGEPTHPVVREATWIGGVGLVSGSHAYAASDGYFRIFDVTDCWGPVELGSTPIDNANADGMALSGAYAYIIGGGGVAVIDVSDPSAPREVGSWQTDMRVWDIAVSGSYAFVLAENHGTPRPNEFLIAIDVSQPSAPVEAGARFPFWGRYNFTPRVEAAGSYLLLMGAGGTTLAFEVNDPIDLADPFTLPQAAGASNIVISGTYNLMAILSGLRVVEFSDPARPIVVGRYFTPREPAVDVTLSGPYAYLWQGNRGLRIIDVSSCWGINPEHPGIPEFPDLPPQEE